jgi:hypothetical protein
MAEVKRGVGGGGGGAGLKEMMLQAKAKAGGTLGVKVEEVSANSKMGVFAPPAISEKAPPHLSEDLSEGHFSPPPKKQKPLHSDII